MKKFLFLLIAAVSLSAVSIAQAPVSLKSQYGALKDTVTSTAAKYLYSPVIRSAYKTVSIVLIATELSGTTAGTATLEASTDGTNWYDYYATLDTSGLKGTTYTLTDVASQSFRWIVTNWADIKFRIKVVGVSTPSVVITGNYVGKL